MQRIDVLIAAVLVVAIVGSALGVATYDDTRRGGEFLVTWATETSELSAGPTTQQGAGEVVLEIPVDAQNLTRLSFTVRVEGSAVRVQPAEILVEVIGPDNATTQQSDATLAPGGPSAVAVPFEFTLGETPTVTRVQGTTPDAARAQLASEHGTTNGTGTWTIRVTIAGTAPGPLAESLAVSATATAESYRAEVTTETPDVQR